MTTIVLNPVLNSDLSTTQSVTFTVPASIRGKNVNVTNCDLQINGISKPNGSVIFAGDRVTLTLQSSNLNATSVYAFASAGDLTWIATVITKAPVITAPIYAYKALAPFDLLTDSNGVTYDPLTSSNFIEIYDTSMNRIKKISAVNPSSSLLGDNRLLTAACNYFNDSLFIIDHESNDITAKVSFNAGARPAAVDYVLEKQVVSQEELSTTTTTSTTYFWVALSGLNQVVKINSRTNAIIQTISTQTRPLGLVTDKSSGDVWFTCYGSDTVGKYVSSTATTTYYNVGSKPLGIDLDSSGNAYVACSGTNLVCKIASSGTVTQVTVGENPWSVRSANGKIYVTNSYSGTISEINLSTLAVTNYSAGGNLPYDLAFDGVNLFVACWGDKTLNKISTSGTLLASTPVDANPFALWLNPSSGTLYLENYYSGMPTRISTHQLSLSPSLSFTPVKNASINSQITSNTVTVSGLEATTNASVPPLPGNSLIKNGVNVGTSTTVSNGDTLAIVTLSSFSFKTKTQAELTIGTTNAIFEITTEALDDVANEFSFNDVYSAALNSFYTSNTVTVSGLSAGITVPVAVSGGILIHNGLVVESANVKNGDTLALRVTSASTVSSPVTAKLTIGTLVTPGPLVFDYYSVHTAGTRTFTTDPSSIFVFNDILGVNRSKQVVTNSITVSGLPDLATEIISIEPIDGNYLTVNGINVGHSAMIKNGDTVSVSVVSSPLINSTKTFNVFIGPDHSTFRVVTGDDQPNPFEFITVEGSYPRNPYTSNVVTLTGVDSSLTVNLSVTKGTINLNGVDVGTSCQATAADQISWNLSPDGPYSGIKTYTMLAGDTESTWTFNNASLVGPVKSKSTLSARSAERGNWIKEESHSEIIFSGNWIKKTNHREKIIKYSTIRSTVNHGQILPLEPTRYAFKQRYSALLDSIRSNKSTILHQQPKFKDPEEKVKILHASPEFTRSIVKDNPFSTPSFISVTNLSRKVYSQTFIAKPLPLKVWSPTFVHVAKLAKTVVEAPIKKILIDKRFSTMVYDKPSSEKVLFSAYGVKSESIKREVLSKLTIARPLAKLVPFKFVAASRSNWEVTFTPEIASRSSVICTTEFEISRTSKVLVPITYERNAYHVTQPIETDLAYVNRFLTAREAELDGLAQGFASVTPIQLADGSWIWTADCMKQLPTRKIIAGRDWGTALVIRSGYIQGG